jgi:uncharacterized protein (DUF302 family)
MEAKPIFCKIHAPEENEFWRYPSHKVLGVIEEPENVSKAIEVLQQAGVSDDEITVECGRQGEDQIDFSGTKHGLLGRFVRYFQELSAEHSYLEYFQKELHSGHFLIEVRPKGREQKKDIANLLHDAGAKRVTYFGNWIIEEIANKNQHIETGAYGLSRRVGRPFAEALAKTKAALQAEGFGVLTEIDMKAKFKEKLDREFANYVILGACNPGYAFEALSFDLNLGLLLPCNVVVYEDAEGTVVTVIDPVQMMAVADNAEIVRIAEEVKARLRSALDNV